MSRIGGLTAGAAGLCLVVAASSPAQAAASSPIAPARKCAAMVGMKIPDSTMTITKAEAVPLAPAGTLRPSQFAPPIAVEIPAYCKVTGTIDPRTGVDGKPYAIEFALALPDKWNGRFLFQGGGGLNGSLNPPLGAQAAGDTPALARGFAVVSTDGGHKAAVFDASFMKDQEAALNFAQGSVGKVTTVAKKITSSYYGRGPLRSYFAGCSTGGREGMLATQRYGNEFDGVVAGAPAMRTGRSNLGLLWATVAFNQAAAKDAAGKPLTAQLFSPTDKKLLMTSLLATCDELDGLKDGMIFNGGACRFDPQVLTCNGPKTEACLSQGQVTALNRAFAGPKNAGGVQLYSPFRWDTGVVAEGGGIPGFLPSSAPSILGPPNPAVEVDMDKAAAAADEGNQHLVDTYDWTNLTTFFGHGGKLLFFHGVSDPWFSANDTIRYYERMAADSGGAEAVKGSSRVFLAPGMGHCGGGLATLDQFDLLSAVVDWVENGKAPDAVTATGAGFPGRSRPLCAWPAHAQYKGSGDPNDAANFDCQP